VAFEYVRFKEIMSAGGIEAACWKIANLAEVVNYYLFSVSFVVSDARVLPINLGTVSQKWNHVSKGNKKVNARGRLGLFESV